MLIPVLAETIGLPIFPTVSVPVGAVEAFNKRGIDRMTGGRERQGFFQRAPSVIVSAAYGFYGYIFQ